MREEQKVKQTDEKLLAKQKQNCWVEVKVKEGNLWVWVCQVLVDVKRKPESFKSINRNIFFSKKKKKKDDDTSIYITLHQDLKFIDFFFLYFIVGGL